MNLKTRIAISLFLVAVLLLSASCALIPTKIQQIMGGDTGSKGAPNVIYVTATPQSGGAGFQTELKITACLYNSDCPDAIDLDDMLNAQQKNSYEVKLPYNSQVKLSNGWVAIDQETLQENLSQIKWILEVNGVDYYKPEFLVDGTVNTIQETSVENYGTWLGVTIKGFAQDEPVTMVVGYTFTKSINDGWEDFPAGYTSTITYNFIPQPLDFGAPTMK